ncbi:MAG TPA: hypothetical protein VHC63_13645 [Acidimicrobiales bacterium]|nr:hypothetical protein [Acidimicrobiales bacterium]
MGRGLVLGVLVLAAAAMGVLGRPVPTQAFLGRENANNARVDRFVIPERTVHGLPPSPVGYEPTDPASTTTTIPTRVEAATLDRTDQTPTTLSETEVFEATAVAPVNGEPAWVAIVVVVLLLSGLRVAAQIQEQRAARRAEDG